MSGQCHIGQQCWIECKKLKKITQRKSRLQSKLCHGGETLTTIELAILGHSNDNSSNVTFDILFVLGAIFIHVLFAATLQDCTWNPNNQDIEFNHVTFLKAHFNHMICLCTPCTIFSSCERVASVFSM